MKTTSKKICAGGYELINKATKLPIGRYGGRSGEKWAQLMNGKIITENSKVSVRVLKELIIYANNQ